MRAFKGFSIISVIITVLLIAVIAAVVLYFIGKGGSGFGGGKGDGTGSGNTESAFETTATEKTLPQITITTKKEMEYVDVKIDGNSYIYNNTSYEISDVSSIVNDIVSKDEKICVRIIDNYASDKAYSELVNALDDKDIEHTDDSEDK